MDQPTGNLSDRIFIRLHPSTTEQLAAVAAEDGRKPGAVARIAIQQYLVRRRLDKQRAEAERELLASPR